MLGSAFYGLLITLVMFLVGVVAPQPAGSLVLWGGLAIHGAWGATVLWRRTRLPFATAAVAAGVFASIAFAVLSLYGYTFASPPRELRSALLIVCLVLLIPLLLFLESNVHPAEWQRWKRFMENKTAWDIVRARHIPDLRTTPSEQRGLSIPGR